MGNCKFCGKYSTCVTCVYVDAKCFSCDGAKKRQHEICDPCIIAISEFKQDAELREEKMARIKLSKNKK